MMKVGIFGASILFFALTGCGEAPLQKEEVSVEHSDAERKGVANEPESVRQDEVASEIKAPFPDHTDGEKLAVNSDRDKLLKKRKTVIGKAFQTLTIGGKQYSGVTVKAISDTGVRIQHKSGITGIDWKDTATVVKDAWGYDEFAYVQYQKKKKADQIFATKVAATKPPVVIPDKSPSKKIKSNDQKKNKLLSGIDEVEAEIARGTIMLKSFETTLAATQEEFIEQDRKKSALKMSRSDIGEEEGTVVSRTIGGVSTSRADRKKKVQVEESRVRNAKLALAKLKAKLKSLERELSSL